MIQFITGDLLKSKAEALVNTVNTVGVMGKGIALQFKEAFPANNKAYIQACKEKNLKPGIILAVWDKSLHYGEKLIINFPTKIHWRSPSKYEYISDGLKALRALILKSDITSIAIPPLGCGNGGLDWQKVKPMIEDALGDLEISIEVFEPNEAIKAILQHQETQKTTKLTPARASLLYMLFAFESLGEYCSLFAANKLAYFLQRMGKNLNLKFNPHHYGPYAIGVEKVLYTLNGVYLQGLEQGQAKPFEPLRLDYNKWQEVKNYVEKELEFEDAERIKKLILFLQGFTSELSLEVLATVDFILQQKPNADIDAVMSGVADWNIRKKDLFRKEHVALAMEHIKSYRDAIM